MTVSSRVLDVQMFINYTYKFGMRLMSLVLTQKFPDIGTGNIQSRVVTVQIYQITYENSGKKYLLCDLV